MPTIVTATPGRLDDYQAFFENSQVGMYRSTPDGRFLVANSALAELLGYESPKQLMGEVTNIGRQLFVEPQARHRAAEEAHQDGSVRNVECRLRRKDGTTVLVSIHSRVVFDKSGEPSYYEGAMFETSQQDKPDQAPLPLGQGNGSNGGPDTRLRKQVTKLESALHRIAGELALLGMDQSIQVEQLSPEELDGFKALTRRETEVLRALVSGDRVRTIAKNFNLAPNTVRNHLKSIFVKLGVRSQTDLVEKLKKRI